MDLQKMYPASNSIIVQVVSDISAIVDEVTVTDVSVFPEAPNFATIGTDNNAEVIVYQGIDLGNNKLTGCLRGQSYTTARDWGVGAFIYHSWTAANANTIMGNIGDISTAIGDPALVAKKPTPDAIIWGDWNFPRSSGPFTPEVIGATTPGNIEYSSRGGTWHIEGNKMLIVGFVALSKINTVPTGAIKLAGIPRAPVLSNGVSTYPAYTYATEGLKLATGQSFSASLASGSTTMNLVKESLSTGAGVEYILPADITAGLRVYFSCTYII